MNQVHIIGCGESAKNWDGIGFSIGVNDCFRYHKTNYLLIINAPNKFTPERMQVIRNSEPDKVFCHTMLWKQYFPNMEYITLQAFTSGQIRPGMLYHSSTSPFAAMSLAYNIGAKEIILWGVDFKTHKHYHPGTQELKSELWKYNFFIEALEAKGTKVYQGCVGSELKLPVWKSSL
jgi:hypothetical protein